MEGGRKVHFWGSGIRAQKDSNLLELYLQAADLNGSDWAEDC